MAKEKAEPAEAVLGRKAKRYETEAAAAAKAGDAMLAANLAQRAKAIRSTIKGGEADEG
jgi:hypothetical protein